MRLALEFGDRHRLAALYNNLADALHRAGEPDEALGALREAVSRFVEVRADVEADWEPEVWLLTEW